MKKILFFVLYLSVNALFSQEVTKKLTDKELITMFGQAIAQMTDGPFNKLNLTDEELKCFFDGFKKGITAKKEEIESLKPYNKQIQEFIEKRIKDFIVKNPPVFPIETIIKNSDGKETTIKDLLKDNKAVLLDFYASWCGPCMALMPALKKKAINFKEKGVLVAGMNTVDVDDANKIKEKFSITFTWLIEPEGRPFSQLLNIESIPRMILIDKEGKVIFNGHPDSPELLEKINKL